MTILPSLLPPLPVKMAWARGHNGIVSTMSRRIPMIPVTCWFSPIAERKRNGAMKKIIVFGYDKSFKKSYRSHVNLSWIKVLVVVSLTDTVSHYLHTTNPDIGGSLVSDLINHRVFVDLGFFVREDYEWVFALNHTMSLFRWGGGHTLRTGLWWTTFFALIFLLWCISYRQSYLWE